MAEPKSVYDELNESIQENLDKVLESIENLKQVVEDSNNEINELLDQLIDKDGKQ